MSPPSSSKRTYEIIWDIVRRIPKGKVATYGQIAEMCGLPNSARLVGYALHNLPPGSKVPWQRVINAQGKISLSDIDGMAERQQQMLIREGVKFEHGKVNLLRFGWLQGLHTARRQRLYE